MVTFHVLHCSFFHVFIFSFFNFFGWPLNFFFSKKLSQKKQERKKVVDVFKVDKVFGLVIHFFQKKLETT